MFAFERRLEPVKDHISIKVGIILPKITVLLFCSFRAIGKRNYLLPLLVILYLIDNNNIISSRRKDALLNERGKRFERKKPLSVKPFGSLTCRAVRRGVDKY